MPSVAPTVVERILLAALELDADGRSFTAEDLVVKAWELSPDRFGLQGYAGKHPDSNRVLTKLMGKDALLRKNGWLRKVGTKRYRLTDLGRSAAEALRNRAQPAESSRRLSEVDRRLLAPLTRMLESTAFDKFIRTEPLTFSDVCGFWNISPRSTAHQLSDQMRAADAAIRAALEEIGRCSTATVSLPGGPDQVEPADIEKLAELSAHIRERFAQDLDIIRSRNDERRL